MERLAVLIVKAGKGFGVAKAEDDGVFAGHRIAEADAGGALEEGLETDNGLLSANAGGEAANEAEAPPGGIGLIELAILGGIAEDVEGQTILERNPEVGGVCGLDTFKALGGDAGDDKGNAFDDDRGAEDVGIAVEAAGPVVVADDEDGGAGGFVLQG